MVAKIKIQALNDGNNTSITFLVLEARRYFEGLYIIKEFQGKAPIKLSKLVIVEIEYLIKEMGA